MIARLARPRGPVNRGRLDRQTRPLVGALDGGVRGSYVRPLPNPDDVLRAKIAQHRQQPVELIVAPAAVVQQLRAAMREGQNR